MKKLRDTGGLSDAEIRLEIDASIKYLLEKKELHQSLTGYPSFDYPGYLAKLDSAKSALALAVKHLQRLETDFLMGHLDAYQMSAHRVHAAYDGAMNAMVQVQIATNETKLFHVPTTRALDLQKSAARLALALVGDRVRGQARSVAIKIMDGANLGNPEKSALTRWLKEIKIDLQKSAVRLALALAGVQTKEQERAVAMKAMDGVGMKMPDSDTLTKWLLEIRAESSNVK